MNLTELLIALVVVTLSILSAGNLLLTNDKSLRRNSKVSGPELLEEINRSIFTNGRLAQYCSKLKTPSSVELKCTIDPYSIPLKMQDTLLATFPAAKVTNPMLREVIFRYAEGVLTQYHIPIDLSKGAPGEKLTASQNSWAGVTRFEICDDTDFRDGTCTVAPLPINELRKTQLANWDSGAFSTKKYLYENRFFRYRIDVSIAEKKSVSSYGTNGSFYLRNANLPNEEIGGPEYKPLFTIRSFE